MANTRKATHDGHCQVCGSRQRLPQGTLAKHGYTTRWGFFTGTCYGSEQLPFEQDKSLVERAIADAEAQKANIERQATELRDTEHQINSGTTAWVHEYVSGAGRVRGGYEWRQVEISVTEREINGHKYTDYTYVKKDGQPYILNRIAGFPYGATFKGVILWLNASRANHLDRQAQQVARYISWQRDRIHDWKPTDLLPRDAK